MLALVSGSFAVFLGAGLTPLTSCFSVSLRLRRYSKSFWPSSDNENDHFESVLPGAGIATLYAFQKPDRERFVHAVLSWDDDPEGQCWSAKHPATSASLP